MKGKIAKVAFVTGANQGIGFATVKLLAKKQPNTLVYLGSRDLNKGKEAAKKLEAEGLENISVLRLDLSDEKTIKEAADTIKTKHDGLDILINNAGLAFHGDVFDEHVARTTLGVNYFGLETMLNHFVPLMNNKGRIINLTSFVGIVSPSRYNSNIFSQFSNPDLTIDQLSKLMNSFIEDVKENVSSEKGWPRTTYGVSKAGGNALTSIWGRKLSKSENNDKNQLMMVSCCPGYVSTAMSSYRGTKTPEQGADTPLWLATDAKFECGSGKFYQDRKEKSWLVYK